MANRFIPESADPDLKEALRRIWDELDRLLGGRNVDWHGRRIINAGDAVDAQDYVTKAQLLGEITTEIIERIVDRDIHIDGVGGGGGGTGGGTGGSDPVNPLPIIEASWPVGSIFISTSPVSPATLLGIGTWELFARGRTLVGIDTTDVDFDTVLEEIGEKNHILTCDELPSDCAFYEP